MTTIPTTPCIPLLKAQSSNPPTLRSVQQVGKKAVQEAGIHKKVTPNKLRQWFTTHLLDGGKDVRYIQELPGHANSITTQIYTPMTNHSLSKIQRPLDKLMAGTPPAIKKWDFNHKKPESFG
jgi:site-specific recombinase XerD